jgi:hypothetical protein
VARASAVLMTNRKFLLQKVFGKFLSYCVSVFICTKIFVSYVCMADV